MPQKGTTMESTGRLASGYPEAKGSLSLRVLSSRILALWLMSQAA